MCLINPSISSAESLSLKGFILVGGKDGGKKKKDEEKEEDYALSLNPRDRVK